MTLPNTVFSEGTCQVKAPGHTLLYCVSEAASGKSLS